jgi:hypothetical protein
VLWPIAQIVQGLWGIAVQVVLLGLVGHARRRRDLTGFQKWDKKKLALFVVNAKDRIASSFRVHTLPDQLDYASVSVSSYWRCNLEEGDRRRRESEKKVVAGWQFYFTIRFFYNGGLSFCSILKPTLLLPPRSTTISFFILNQPARSARSTASFSLSKHHLSSHDSMARRPTGSGGRERISGAAACFFFRVACFPQRPPTLCYSFSPDHHLPALAQSQKPIPAPSVMTG